MLRQIMRRLEDPKFLTGHARFIDDIRLSNMVHCVFVRSPYAHAKIVRIDPSEALKSGGVVSFIDGRQVEAGSKPLYTMIPGMRYYGIAVDHVRYVGEPVAMVLADSLEEAVDAAEKVYVEYKPLKPVMSIEDALGSSQTIHEEIKSNIVLHREYIFGDVENALADSDEVVREKFIFERYAASPIETCGVIADYGGDGRLVIYDNQQTPLLFRGMIASSLNMNPADLRFIEPDIGGGFGVKIMVYPYVFLIGFASRSLRRPVKWVETRREHLQAMAHNSNRVFETEMGVKRSGEVTALRTYFVEDCGAWVRLPDPGGTIRSLMTYLGCYRIRNVAVKIDVVVTNKCPTGPVRGYGCQHTYFMLERLMDMAAKRLGIDPAEIRFRNFVRPEEQPYRAPFGCIYDGGDYAATLRKALELAEAGKYLGQPHVGVGIACVVEPAVTNLGRNRMLFQHISMSGSGEGAVIRMEEDGAVSVWIASIPQGQGHDTVVTQLVCESLSLRPEDVRVHHGDSDAVHPSPFGGTWASRFSVMTTAAVKKACDDLRRKIIGLASTILEASPSDLELRDSAIWVRGSETHITFRELAWKAYRDSASLKGINSSLSSQYFYDFPGFNVGGPGEINMSATYGNSAHIAIVSVDPETFQTSVLKYVAVHDCGNILNQTIVDGQIHGGVMQGLASALYEKIAYDDDGQLATQTLADYLIPTAVESPTIVVDHLITPSLFSELGSKGMGEGPSIPVAAALANAVSNALGREITTSHLDAPYLWKICRAKK